MVSPGAQRWARVEFARDGSAKWRFDGPTRSLMLRFEAQDTYVGCWVCPVADVRIEPGFTGSVVIEDLLDPALPPEESVPFEVWYGRTVGAGQLGSALFADPYAPTEDELREWAQTAAHEPAQDFGLVIRGDDALLAAIVDLTESACSAKTTYFESLLYGRVGDEVRVGRAVPATIEVVERLGRSDNDRLRRFAHRARQLRSNPGLFDYDAWCDGQLASDESDWPGA